MSSLALPAPAPFRDGTRRLGGLLVLLLHGALALALWQLPAWRDRGAAPQERPPLLLRLWWPDAAAPTARPAPAGPRARQAAPTRTQPQAITDPSPLLARPAAAPAGTEAPAATAGSAEVGPSAAPSLAPTAAAPAQAPLNLSLPRSASAPWRQRNPALDDPRSNTAKLTLEQKLANAMGGDGSWHEERLDLDTVRWRRGNECIVATRSRAGQLELGSNGAFRNSWLVRSC